MKPDSHHFPLMAAARKSIVMFGIVRLRPAMMALFMALYAGSAVATDGIDILIEGNPNLAGLDGLEQVFGVNSITIKSNPALPNLNPLANLERVVGALEVQTNVALGDCKALAPVLGWPDGEVQHVGSASISGNATGCVTETEILQSVLGPSKPTIIGQSFSIPSGNAGDSLINMLLDFNPAIERETIFRVTGHRATCSSTVYRSDPSPMGTDLAIPLLDFTPVTRTLAMPGSAGRNDSAFVAEIEVGVDIAHTDPVDLLVTLKNPEGVGVVLWDQSSPNSENLVGTFPTTLSPAESLDALARERMGGRWSLVVEDVGQGPIIREGTLNSWDLQISEESVTEKNFTAGENPSPINIKGVGGSAAYTCTVTALSRLGATPVSDDYAVTIPRLPGQPVISRTDYDDGAVFLYVALSDNGGSAITRYDATCTDGSNSFTGSSTNSRITISGLNNGVAYRCSVTATNALGESVVSAVSAQITPQESEDLRGLPIWLIYQATQ